jgi:hypothetical protein
MTKIGRLALDGLADGDLASGFGGALGVDAEDPEHGKADSVRDEDADGERSENGTDQKQRETHSISSGRYCSIVSVGCNRAQQKGVKGVV